jgi:membrane protease YdiL (CAAX protease family)
MPPKNPHRWRALGRVLLFVLGCAAMLAVASPLTPILSGQWSQFVLGAGTSLGALALTVVFVRWEGLRLQDVGAAPGQRSLSRVAFGFLVGLLLVALRSSIVWAAGHIRWVRAPGSGFAATAIAFLAYSALSCREELAFHGYPLRRLELDFGLWRAQLIVAAVFAVEHVAGGLTWAHALLGAGVGSLLFGMAALSTRGLAVPVGLHAAWNFGDWMLGGKGSAGLWMPVIDVGWQARVDVAGTIGYFIVMGSATLAFWFWDRRMNSMSRDFDGQLP